MRAFALSLILFAPHAGCSRAVQPPSDARASASCPSEELIESLHAAAFYFDNGPAEAARERARHALALAASVSDATSEQLLEHVASMSQLGDDTRRNEAELMRVALSDWACLTPEMHQSFHSRLPPLPGGRDDC